MSSIEEEELRRRKLEEALEVKSLRLIISAYLKYTAILHSLLMWFVYSGLCLLQKDPSSGFRIERMYIDTDIWVMWGCAARDSWQFMKYSQSRECYKLVDSSSFEWMTGYPEAAEDIRRYERCFRKLPLAQGPFLALLSHLPLKFQKLRWCVSQNSYFIFEMLKAFDPPLDMSADIHISEDQVMENSSDDHLLSGERNLLPCQSGSNSGKLRSAKADELGCGEGSIGTDGPLKQETVSEEKKTESVNNNVGNCSGGIDCNGKVDAVNNGVEDVNNSLPLSSTYDCHGHNNVNSAACEE
ncbi:UNVERIFIED_CONTAM: hypothetical protein Sradi_0920900 [Sesamum radiatum]|uniref:Uncharacterized protein n=1 Tax=Sesamum radiatum TaxID=300843 RepID=A0AAW2V3C9_SESRA